MSRKTLKKYKKRKLAKVERSPTRTGVESSIESRSVKSRSIKSRSIKSRTLNTKGKACRSRRKSKVSLKKVKKIIRGGGWDCGC